MHVHTTLFRFGFKKTKYTTFLPLCSYFIEGAAPFVSGWRVKVLKSTVLCVKVSVASGQPHEEGGSKLHVAAWFQF